MKKILLLCFILFLFYFYTLGKKEIIPEQSIRLRILANSNSKNDQNIKKEVSVAVQKDLYQILNHSKNIDESRKIILSNLPNLNQTIRSTLAQKNYSPLYSLEYGKHPFPVKEYKGVTYQAGEYESLLITLGKGEGDNWWCVLFPPLCLMEAEESKEVNQIEYDFFLNKLIKQWFK